MSTELLVLGLGNLLCRDDGAGVEAIRRLLEDWEPADGVVVEDGGTLGMALLPMLGDAHAAILVDAVAARGRHAGELLTLEGDAVPRAAMERLSPHQVGVGDLLHGAMWSDSLPDPLLLVGVVPEETHVGLGRTGDVEAAIPAMVARVVELAADLGFPFRRRNATAERRSRPAL